MAENSEQTKTNSPPRSPRKNAPPSNSHHYKNRNPGVQKAINVFGVRDLRELLVKKRQEQDEQPSPRENPRAQNPPPDPEYNFLKDPLRDNTQDKQNQQSKESNKGNKNRKHENTFREHNKPPNRDPRRKPHQNRNKEHNTVAESTHENLSNIKVELTVATGLRNCVVDETLSKIEGLKHFSDDAETSKTKYSGRSYRFRPRRGGGKGGYRNREKENDTDKTCDNINTDKPEATASSNDLAVASLEESFQKTVVITASKIQEGEEEKQNAEEFDKEVPSKEIKEESV